MKKFCVGMVRVSMILLCASLLSQAQQTVATNTSVAVPPLVNFKGVLTDVNAKSLTGITGVTFLLYQNQQGGAPLWMETQNVQLDKTGHYSVMLGATSSTGLPANIFATGEAHWLGVQVQGQPEQPRVMLLSVPYALKAGDAQTIGGLPPSAFALAVPVTSGTPAAATGGESSASLSSTPPPSTSAVTTSGGGPGNIIPMFTTATNIQNSILTQTGTSISVHGTLALPAIGTANSTTKGFNSQPADYLASVYNGTSPVSQHFRWQAEPVNAGSASASGKLNLLFASGAGTPAETGLSISKGGIITFAKGQTLPAVTGNETVTGNVTASQLISNVATGIPPLTVNSTTQVPNLNASLLDGLSASSFATAGTNSFSGNQTVSGYVNALAPSGSGFAMQGVNNSTTGQAFGVQAANFAPAGAAVFGFSGGLSTIGGNYNNTSTSSGIWADQSTNSTSLRQALLATADDAASVFAVNNSPSGFPTIQAVQNGSGSALLANSTGGIGIAVNGGAGTSLVWGNSGGGWLTNDQGGSVELGGNNTLTNSSGNTPYIDFHYGADGKTVQDYNARLINDGNGQLSIDFAPVGFGAQLLKVNGQLQVSRLPGVNGALLQADSNGNIGIQTSSRRFKEKIQDMGNATDPLMRLRPVTFLYKPEYSQDGPRTLQYGLIAEEVAKVYPELVAYDRAGDPYTVRYQLLAPMLLNEVQKLHRQSEADRASIAGLKKAHAADQAQIANLKLQIAKQAKLSRNQEATMKALLTQVRAIQLSLKQSESAHAGERLAASSHRESTAKPDGL